MKSLKIVLSILLLAGLAPVFALAQSGNGGIVMDPIYDGATVTTSYNFTTPNQVQRYYVYCADATQVKISVADGGYAGDKWKATCYIYDKVPQKKTTTASGAVSVYSAGAILKNAGMIPLRVYVEVRYSRGINDFGAMGYIKFESNGTAALTVTNLGISNY